MNRKNIITKIIEEQNKVIANLNASVERYATASDIDEESTHDPDDFSQQTQAKDMQLRYEKMKGDAMQQLQFLEKEGENIHDEIEEGALIETDKKIFFVGISVSVFEIEDKEVVSFSEDAPIFKEMKGKNSGDQFKIGDETFMIKSIS